jgi:hypothetical protein
MRAILISLLSILLVSGCGHAPIPTLAPPPPGLKDHSVTLTWQQSFANNGACSSTVTVSCISGFYEGYMTGTTQTQLNTNTSAVCTGTVQPENCTATFNAVLPIGIVVFYVVTTYIDQNGVAGVTASATSVGVPVAADKPTGLTVTVGS